MTKYDVFQDFPGDPGVKTLHSNTGGASLIPGWSAKISTCLTAKTPKHKTEYCLCCTPETKTTLQINYTPTKPFKTPECFNKLEKKPDLKRITMCFMSPKDKLKEVGSGSLVVLGMTDKSGELSGGWKCSKTGLWYCLLILTVSFFKNHCI